MCGRNSVFIAQEQLEERFDAQVVYDEYQPRFNLAPHQPHPVITNEAPDEVTAYRWGLVPQWMDDPSDGFINARSETADEKPAFRDAWEERPCLVPSTGFYEWQTANGGPKQPYRIHRPDEPAFAMAGLWEPQHNADDTLPGTVTILTTEPSAVMQDIHDRMPVILPSDEEHTWLAGDPADRHELCQPYPGDDLDAYPISHRVNNPQNDDAGIIEPVESEQSSLGEFS